MLDEVNHACAYLAIERARLGEEKLSVQTAVEGTVRDTRIPALLLQPIVENAVRHGVAPKAGPGMISIRALDFGDRLRVEVEDEADGPRQEHSTRGSGMALQTLRKRLEKHYDGKAELRLSPSVRGTVVTLDLPKQPASHEGTP